MNEVTKTFDGKKFNYFFGDQLFRRSTRDYKYACIATSRQHANPKPFVISIGNKVDSTRNSMAHCYAHYCDLEVVAIKKVSSQ